jgi:hypothetical protein
MIWKIKQFLLIVSVKLIHIDRVCPLNSLQNAEKKFILSQKDIAINIDRLIINV